MLEEFDCKKYLKHNVQGSICSKVSHMKRFCILVWRHRRQSYPAAGQASWVSSQCVYKPIGCPQQSTSGIYLRYCKLYYALLQWIGRILLCSCLSVGPSVRPSVCR